MSEVNTPVLLARFGSAVRKLRTNLGISQEELAGRAGLHRTYVSDIERGARNISLGSIERLAMALEISLTALFAHARAGNEPASEKRQILPNEFVEILLVEDEPSDVELTLKAFEMAGIPNRVHVARDGMEALEFFFGSNGRARLKSLPGVILLDLQLPKVSGMEVLRRVKNDPRFRQIPVVVLTMSQKDRDAQECKKLGADAYLVKPVGFRNFSEVTNRLSMQWALLKPASPR